MGEKVRVIASTQWVLQTVFLESKLEVTTEILDTVCLGRGFFLLKWEDPSLALYPWTLLLVDLHPSWVLRVHEARERCLVTVGVHKDTQ